MQGPTQGLGELDDLYRDIILDHFRSPRNAEPLDDPAVEIEADNPFCGDELRLQLNADAERVTEVSVSGRGCSISQSSASLMAEMVEGKTVAELRRLYGLFRGLMTGEDLSEDQLDALEDLLALQGVRRYPVRIKCALLAWSALADALDQLEADGGASA